MAVKTTVNMLNISVIYYTFCVVTFNISILVCSRCKEHAF